MILAIYNTADYFILKKAAQMSVAAHMAFNPLQNKLKESKGTNAIYQPAGAAREYAPYASNLYIGCSGMCKYCYNKRGPRAGTLGNNYVTLKKCFGTEGDAIVVFFLELFGGNGGTVRYELLSNGIFICFTTDPCLPETFPLHAAIIAEAIKLGVPFKILTKVTDWLGSEIWQDLKCIPEAKEKLSIGVTLTGRDDLEPGVSSNQDRVNALSYLHNEGFKTFASIEPVIDSALSLSIIQACVGFVDLFMVGLESNRHYDKGEVVQFVNALAAIPEKPTIYLKDSIMGYFVGYTRASFGPNFINTVPVL